ncbi:MAG: YecA family protein [Paraglaciecola sp.]|uniref:UPF0149 family protein n=1 Tax=Paraglaciecola sp. TaxID=1920173 RepID=UPI00273E3D43|nr:UPF0149 family protein [Paraglaciecola sp.]MDP5029982.1 YecA family protein [Paraglaciecola sp.]MDP5131577.1 YecA family protein [Paraglaciecola sp.]
MSILSQACHQNLYTLATTGPDNTHLQAPYIILGTIFAVAAAPDIPMPDVWLPWIFKSSAKLEDIQDLHSIHESAMGCLQWQLQQMRDEHIALFSELDYSEQKNSPLAQWMQGLLFAHTQLDKVWQIAWQAMLKSQHAEVEKLQKDLKHCLSVLSTFADIPFALTRLNSEAKTHLSAALPRIYQSLPEVLQTYVATSGQLIEYLPNQFETFIKP